MQHTGKFTTRRPMSLENKKAEVRAWGVLLVTVEMNGVEPSKPQNTPSDKHEGEAKHRAHRSKGALEELQKGGLERRTRRGFGEKVVNRHDQEYRWGKPEKTEFKKKK